MKKDIALKLKNIKKSFYHSRKNGIAEHTRILKNLSLDIPAREVTALIGGNGVGKTTLFNIISGLLPADAGSIEFYSCGQKKMLLNIKPYKIVRLGIGRMFQDNHIFSNLTVMENMLIAEDERYGETPFVSMFTPRQSKKCEAARVNAAEKVFSELFGDNSPFIEKRNELAGFLSYGQQRLLGLARLLMGDYKMVLLDEPTAGVNPLIVEQIKLVIEKMKSKQNMTVFVIEHNMRFVSDIADNCAFLADGGIAQFDNTAAVLENEAVRRSYLSVANTD